MAKALSHPLRARALMRLGERVASPKELAVEIGVPLQNMVYHVNVLRDLGCVELVDTAQRRGATEHFYRATRRNMLNDRAWRRLSRRSRQGLTTLWYDQSFADAGQALDDGSIDARTDRHVSFTPLLLDDEAWTEMKEHLDRLLERGMELQAESAGRAQDRGQPLMSTRLLLAHYLAAGQGGRAQA